MMTMGLVRFRAESAASPRRRLWLALVASNMSLWFIVVVLLMTTTQSVDAFFLVVTAPPPLPKAPPSSSIIEVVTVLEQEEQQPQRVIPSNIRHQRIIEKSSWFQSISPSASATTSRTAISTSIAGGNGGSTTFTMSKLDAPGKKLQQQPNENIAPPKKPSKLIAPGKKPPNNINQTTPAPTMKPSRSAFTQPANNFGPDAIPAIAGKDAQPSGFVPTNCGVDTPSTKLSSSFSKATLCPN